MTPARRRAVPRNGLVPGDTITRRAKRQAGVAAAITRATVTCVITACGGSTEDPREPAADDPVTPGYLTAPARPGRPPICESRGDIESQLIEDFEFGAAGGWYLSNDVCSTCQDIINAADALRNTPLPPPVSAQAEARRDAELRQLSDSLDSCELVCLSVLETPNYFDNPPVAEPIPGGRCESRYAMHIKGGPFLEWGGNMGFSFSPPVNVSDTEAVDPVTGAARPGQNWHGISFWARLGDTGGNNTLRVEVGEKHTDQEYVGPDGNPICTPNTTEANSEYGCDKFGYIALLRSEWQQFLVPFAEMRQQGWGMRADYFDLTALTSLAFFYPQGTWDFWVDDLRFYRRSP